MKLATSTSRACQKMPASLADSFYVIDKTVTCNTKTTCVYGRGIAATGCDNTHANTTAYIFPVAPGIFIISCNDIKAKRIYLFIAITLLANILFTQNTYAQVTGPGAAWQYVRKVTLAPATPAANFQVKVTLAAAQYGNMNANGNDLLFYDINNNLCNYWIELWNNTGSSTIWVNVPTSGSTAVYMYYGNAGAIASSNGATTFDFFDDFMGTSLALNWQQSTSNGNVAVSGGNVTLSCNSNTGSAYISSAFSPASTSFVVETKNQEPHYYRNRFYAGTAIFGSNPFGFDNGYFNSGAAGAYTTAQVFWNGTFQTGNLTAGTNYLTQWQITDGNGATYAWNTYTYATMALIRSNTNPNTATAVRYINIGVTEASGTSTVVDWVRVRKAASTFTDVTGTAGAQITNISASINSQTNLVCNGQPTGSATVTTTGGSTPYTYSWNSSPIQTNQTATNLPAGAYTVTVTDNNGISATATATITQPTAVVASVNGQTNVTCSGGTNGNIVIAASGGSGAGYSYSVDNGATWVGPFASPYTYPNLSANVAYKIRVKDNLGCTSKSVQ